MQPIPVLLHGFLGFYRWGPVTYFRGVEMALRRSGIEPLLPALPPAGSIAERAEALAHILNRHPSSAFVLIAHSMGGLDGRFLITHLDPDRRVRSLVTVATPHRGTPIARRMLNDKGLLPAVSRHYWPSALRDLVPETREREVIPDREDVIYQSYAASRERSELPLWLRYVAGPLKDQNDGLVPLASTYWGQFRGQMRADHLEIVGWSLGLPSRSSARPFDHLAFWQQIVVEAVEPTEPTGEQHATSW